MQFIHIVHICNILIQCTHAQYIDAIHACSAHIQCIHSTNSAYMQCTQDYLSVSCEWACLCKLSSETMRALKVFPDFWHETETILGVRNLVSCGICHEEGGSFFLREDRYKHQTRSINQLNKLAYTSKKEEEMSLDLLYRRLTVPSSLAHVSLHHN